MLIKLNVLQLKLHDTSYP